jgi:MFS family permease
MARDNVMVATGTAAIPRSEASVGRLYAYTVLAMCVLLMISDYATRQSITSMFPLIKKDWLLSDSQLGMLVSIVSISVGITTIPIALLADRWGRVKSITLMVLIWCLATVFCGIAKNYEQILTARFIVGLGEGAYAAGGAALLAYAFPARQRGAVMGVFQSAALVGSMLGVMLGGALAVKYGWHMTFIIIGAPGLLLAILFFILVRDYKTVALAHDNKAGEKVTVSGRFKQIVRAIFASRSGNIVFVGNGLQMGMPIVIIAWLTTYLNRYFGMDVKKAAAMTALTVLVGAVGLALGGVFADRMSRKNPRARVLVPAAYTALTGISLIAAFALPPGPLALGLILVGALFSTAQAGPAVAMLVEVTHPAVRATVTGVCVVFGNFLGQALAPFLVGLMSDLFSLKGALTVIPVVSFASAVLFVLASRTYLADMAKYKINEPPDGKAKL